MVRKARDNRKPMRLLLSVYEQKTNLAEIRWVKEPREQDSTFDFQLSTCFPAIRPSRPYGTVRKLKPTQQVHCCV